MPKSKFALKIASERIENLFDLATQASKKNQKKLSARYIKLARQISSHYKVTIPIGLKRLVCKNCGEIQIPGINSRVIVASSKNCIIYRCKCGAQNKIFYKKATSHSA